MIDLGYENDNYENRFARSEFLKRRDSSTSRKEDHEPVMHRSFSSLAGLAFRFRYVDLIFGEENLLLI